ncbi:MAG: ParB/RepB/Spo0J family partition protein [Bacillota bacterium]|jgi:ParB family chromosome partitioning protein|nr:ParB/RepB/Spo0J family partition protein [Bacillota bacterium]NLJ02136.1 ParB/RepB/Spo0J family partition protein [Bacillota bacterium]
MSSQRLGRGLRALIPEVEEPEAAGDVQEISLDLIEPNPFQPREYFDPEKLEELAQSIKEFGLLEPVIVRKSGAGFQLAAGERRVRAARLAGLDKVPALLREFDDLEMMRVALVENLQRENLNPVEEAEGYQRLIDEFGYTQAQVAQAVGRKRPSIANSLRLLNLGEVEKEMVRDGRLSSGHAKVLLGVSDKKKRVQLANKVVKDDLSVRQLEELIKKSKIVPRRTLKIKSPELVELEEELQRIFGTKVSMSYKKGAGRITIEYYSDEELERLLDMMKGI